MVACDDAGAGGIVLKSQLFLATVLIATALLPLASADWVPECKIGAVDNTVCLVLYSDIVEPCAKAPDGYQCLEIVVYQTPHPLLCAIGQPGDNFLLCAYTGIDAAGCWNLYAKIGSPDQVSLVQECVVPGLP